VHTDRGLLLTEPTQPAAGPYTLLCVPGTMCTPRIFDGLAALGLPVAVAPWNQVIERPVYLRPAGDLMAALTSYPAQLSAAAVEQALRSQRDTDLLPELHRLPELPALIVHGRYDTARTLAHASQLAAALPAAELVVLDCGHSPPAELPGQFSATLGQWLRLLPGMPPDA
jgi:pimeloyl-ACP methyl ester carboxylesterase